MIMTAADDGDGANDDDNGKDEEEEEGYRVVRVSAKRFGEGCVKFHKLR